MSEQTYPSLSDAKSQNMDWIVMDERTISMVDEWIQRTHGKDDDPEYIHVERAALSQVLCALVNAEETLGRAALAYHHKDERAIQLRNMANICRSATGGLR